MNPKHTAVYVRVSTDGAKNGHTQTTAMQKLEIEAHLKLKGITSFQVYEDKGISGTKKDRPGLKKLFKDCRDGKVSLVVCWKIDRLFRSLKDLMDTLSEWQSLGIEFIALKDNIDLSSATGRLMMQILGAFSEFEVSVIRERVNSGLANARSKGVRLGPPIKPGHEMVKKMYEEGKSVSEIATHLNLSRQTVYRDLKDSL